MHQTMRSLIRPFFVTALFISLALPLVATSGILAAHDNSQAIRILQSRFALPVTTPTPAAGLYHQTLALQRVSSSLVEARQATILPPPPVQARAAFLFDVTNQSVLFAKNPNVALPMASTTKIMTAYLALLRGQLGDRVRISSNAASTGGSTMHLRAGEVLSLQNLLYGLLLPSGNDAAVAIAEHVGGAVPAFVGDMNSEAVSLGLTRTHFANPHGLDAPAHVTSARDLAFLALQAMTLPEFRTIVSTRYDTIPATAVNNPHYLINLNQPLWWYPGVLGVKTGATQSAGRAVVEWAVQGSHTLLLVLLGDRNDVTDVRNLLNYGFGDFHQWTSPLNATPVFPAEDFSWDSQRSWIPDDQGGRYYERTGFTVKGAMLTSFLNHGGSAALGPPISREYRVNGVWRQQFSASWLYFDGATGVSAPTLREVTHS